MKIIFIDLALKYINPTRNLLPGLFSLEDVKFFGRDMFLVNVLKEVFRVSLTNMVHSMR